MPKKHKKILYVTSITFLILILVTLLIILYSVKTAKNAVSEISGAKTFVTTMLIAVRAEDPAQSIDDLNGYTIGIQQIAHRGETNEVLRSMENKYESKPKTIPYETIQAEANALLSGEVGAIVYSGSFTDILNESIENWSARIRILSENGIASETERKDADVTKPFCLYVSGIDTSGPVNSTGRSDVNILVEINPVTHKILLVTTPRDYYVEIPDISGGQKDKLTHAGIYGPDASMRTLSQIYGTTVDYYAKLNFTSLIDIIDTLGGIDVNVSQNFESNGYEFMEGTQHMDGKQALAYCRERKTFTDGDLQRGKNQEAVLTAVIKKCLSPDILFKLDELSTELSDTVETSMPMDKINQLIRMQITNMSGWDIKSTAADGTTSSQPCYSYGETLLSVVIPNQDSIDQIKARITENQKV